MISRDPRAGRPCRWPLQPHLWLTMPYIGHSVVQHTRLSHHCLVLRLRYNRLVRNVYKAYATMSIGHINIPPYPTSSLGIFCSISTLCSGPPACFCFGMPPQSSSSAGVFIAADWIGKILIPDQPCASLISKVPCVKIPEVK